MPILIFLITIGFADLASANVSQEDFDNLVQQVILLDAKVEELEDQNNNLQAVNNDLVERVTRLEVRCHELKLRRLLIPRSHITINHVREWTCKIYLGESIWSENPSIVSRIL